MTDTINKVRFTSEASFEFLKSVEWYESKKKGLGLRFGDGIDSTVDRIKLNPNLFQKIIGDIRRIQVHKFPYSVFYHVENRTLVILRIFHNKRVPVDW